MREGVSLIIKPITHRTTLYRYGLLRDAFRLACDMVEADPEADA